MAAPTPAGIRFRVPNKHPAEAAMKTTTLTLRPKPEPPRGFWSLPRELRDVIYELCLVELPRWEKRHNAFCPAAARDCNVLERPAWKRDYNGELDTCARRLGLGLLRVSRRVHGEAYGLFWSRNTFCWETCRTFTDEVGGRLRPECRERIRHVSIVTDSWEVCPDGTHPAAAAARDQYTAFWRVVKLCDDLRTLEVRPEYMAYHHDHVSALGTPEYCPRLASLRMTHLMALDVRPPRAPNAWYVWIQASKAVDPAALVDMTASREAVRAYRTNFAVHVHHALDTELVGYGGGRFATLGTRIRNEPVRPAFDPRAAGHLDETAGPLAAALRDGTVAALRVYGLPISRATRLRRARQRARVDEARRLAGRRTVGEERARAEVAERRADARASVEKGRAAGMAEQLAQRLERRRNAALREEQDDARSRAEMAWAKASEVRRAQEARAAQRKRSGRNDT